MTTAPIFTTEQIKQDATNRVAKTGGQAGVATAVMLIAVGALKARGWLHGDLGNELFGAYVLVLTTAASAATNIGRFRGKQ